MKKNGLTALEWESIIEQIIYRHGFQQNRCGLLIRDSVGDAHERGTRKRNGFRIRTHGHCKSNSLAYGKVVHTFTYSIDHTCSLTPEPCRKRQGIETRSMVCIDKVNATSAHTDSNLSRIRGWFRHILHRHLLRSAAGFNSDCSYRAHRIFSFL